MCILCEYRIGVVWWKADTRVKLWLPPSEFQGTGALRPHPDGCHSFSPGFTNPKRQTYGQHFFLGSPLCRMGWQEAVPGPQWFCHTSFCIWFTISLPDVLLILPVSLGALLAGADVGPSTRDKAKIHTSTTGDCSMRD